jgi:hypothetical protein
VRLRGTHRAYQQNDHHSRAHCSNHARTLHLRRAPTPASTSRTKGPDRGTLRKNHPGSMAILTSVGPWTKPGESAAVGAPPVAGCRIGVAIVPSAGSCCKIRRSSSTSPADRCPTHRPACDEHLGRRSTRLPGGRTGTAPTSTGHAGARGEGRAPPAPPARLPAHATRRGLGEHPAGADRVPSPRASRTSTSTRPRSPRTATSQARPVMRLPPAPSTVPRWQQAISSSPTWATPSPAPPASEAAARPTK